MEGKEVVEVQPEMEAAPEQEAPEQQPGEVQEPEQVQYTPNYKFKVLEEEKEFDEWVRPVIKDAEHEKKIRELYEKAYGLDHVKAERQKYRDDYKTLKEESDALNASLDQLSRYIKNDDLSTFFKELGIPEQKVLRYAIERAQYGELSPEQRQHLDRQEEERQRLYYLERENQELSQYREQQAISQRMGELEGKLRSPEIAPAVQSFDSRVGRSGAFMEEVIKRGQYYASLPQPQDISVEQAVNEVLNLVGWAGQSQQTSQVPSDPKNTVVVKGEGKPTIPNIQGKGTSPTRKVPTSLEDLRKMQAQFS